MNKVIQISLDNGKTWHDMTCIDSKKFNFGARPPLVSKTLSVDAIINAIITN
jgi:hypothetical protein